MRAVMHTVCTHTYQWPAAVKLIRVLLLLTVWAQARREGATEHLKSNTRMSAYVQSQQIYCDLSQQVSRPVSYGHCIRMPSSAGSAHNATD